MTLLSDARLSIMCWIKLSSFT